MRAPPPKAITVMAVNANGTMPTSARVPSTTPTMSIGNITATPTPEGIRHRLPCLRSQDLRVLREQRSALDEERHTEDDGGDRDPKLRAPPPRERCLPSRPPRRRRQPRANCQIGIRLRSR